MIDSFSLALTFIYNYCKVANSTFGTSLQNRSMSYHNCQYPITCDAYSTIQICNTNTQYVFYHDTIGICIFDTDDTIAHIMICNMYLMICDTLQ